MYDMPEQMQDQWRSRLHLRRRRRSAMLLFAMFGAFAVAMILLGP